VQMEVMQKRRNQSLLSSFLEKPVYSGTLVEGKMEGEGKLTMPNGDRYTGHFMKSKKHGFGECFYSTGDVYAGT